MAMSQWFPGLTELLPRIYSFAKRLFWISVIWCALGNCCGLFFLHEIAPWIVILLMGLKSFAVFNAIFWLAKHGQAFVNDMKASGAIIATSGDPSSRRDKFLEKHKAIFWPWGGMDFRFRRIAARLKYKYFDLGPILLSFHDLFFRMSSLILVAILSTFSSTNGNESSIVKCSLSVLAVMVLVMTLLMELEIGCAHLIVGLDYALYFHGRPINANSIVEELFLIADLAFRVVLAVGIACYACDAADCKALEFSLRECEMPKFLQCLLFGISCFTTIDYNQIVPHTPFGGVICSTSNVIGLVFLVLTFQILLTTLSSRTTNLGNS